MSKDLTYIHTSGILQVGPGPGFATTFLSRSPSLRLVTRTGIGVYQIDLVPGFNLDTNLAFAGNTMNANPGVIHFTIASDVQFVVERYDFAGAPLDGDCSFVVTLHPSI